MLCLGTNFTDNCVNGTNDEGIDFIMGYNSNFQFTLVGERLLCPNKDNGLKVEDLSCLLNVTKDMPLYAYNCTPRRKLMTPFEFEIVGNQESMLCQLLDADDRCGRKVGKALCQMFELGYMSYFGLPNFDYSCNLYMTYECRCTNAIYVFH